MRAFVDVHTGRPTAPSVEELRRAYQAAVAGAFRAGPARAGEPSGPAGRSTPEGTQMWAPTEPVVPVVGCHGGAGASTVALAIATAHQSQSRVIECAAAIASAFVTAATAELGATDTGWLRGQRGRQRLEHLRGLPATPQQVPLPDPAPQGTDLSVLDVSWPLHRLQKTTSWLAATLQAAPVLVLVSTATVPGIRRLEATLHLLGNRDGVIAAVHGYQRRERWAPPVERATGPGLRALREQGQVVHVPHDQDLAVRGLDTRPLPAGVVAAATQIVRLAQPAVSTTPRTSPPLTGR